MREIPLTQGMVALVDDEDYEEVSRYRWHAVKKRGGRTWYAMTNVRRSDGKRTTIEMHAVILGKAPGGHQIDHRNENGLDNRRGNLRYATRSEQIRNRSTAERNQTGFKGVVVHKRGSKRYQAALLTAARRYSLGYFHTAEEAARAFDVKARQVYGEFARLNFPDVNVNVNVEESENVNVCV